MPSSSKKQHNFMAAVANNPSFAKKVGVPQSVGKDFNQADKGRKFAKGGDMKHEDVKMDKAMMQKAVNKHESRLHKGQPKTLPAVLGATKLGVEAPLPRITLLAVKVARPVPPWSTPRVPVDTKFLLASVNTGLLAVRPESRMFPTVSLVPSNVMFAEAPKAPELLN